VQFKDSQITLRKNPTPSRRSDRDVTSDELGAVDPRFVDAERAGDAELATAGCCSRSSAARVRFDRSPEPGDVVTTGSPAAGCSATRRST
jgi:hypothetical protein